MEESLGDARAWYVEVINLLKSKALSPTESLERKAATAILKSPIAFGVVFEPYEDLEAPIAVSRAFAKLCCG